MGCEQPRESSQHDSLFSADLRDPNFLKRAHHINAVLHNLGHRHLVAVQNAGDRALLPGALRVKLKTAHFFELILWDASHAVHESFVSLHKTLQNRLVVEYFTLLGHYDLMI